MSKILIVGNGVTIKQEGYYYKDKHTKNFLRDCSVFFEKVFWFETPVNYSNDNGSVHSEQINDFTEIVKSRINSFNLISRIIGNLNSIFLFLKYRKEVDYIYFFYYGTTSKILSLISFLSNDNYGFYIRSDIFNLTTIEKWVISKSKFVLVVGDRFKILLGDYNKNIHQVAPMIDISEKDFKLKDDFHFDILKCLFVGRIEKVKGIYLIVDALKMLKDANVNFNFTFIGGGSEIDDLKDYVHKKHLNNYIEIIGPISDKKILTKYYEESDLFVFPSSHEGFPRVLYEAMSKSLPIITTPVGSILSLMNDGYNCLITSSTDSRKLFETIMRINSDISLREKIGRNGFKTLRVFIESFSGESHSMQVRKYFEGEK